MAKVQEKVNSTPNNLCANTATYSEKSVGESKKKFPHVKRKWGRNRKERQVVPGKYTEAQRCTEGSNIDSKGVALTKRSAVEISTKPKKRILHRSGQQSPSMNRAQNLSLHSDTIADANRPSSEPTLVASQPKKARMRNKLKNIFVRNNKKNKDNGGKKISRPLNSIPGCHTGAPENGAYKAVNSSTSSSEESSSSSTESSSSSEESSSSSTESSSSSTSSSEESSSSSEESSSSSEESSSSSTSSSEESSSSSEESSSSQTGSPARSASAPVGSLPKKVGKREQMKNWFKRSKGNSA